MTCWTFGVGRLVVNFFGGHVASASLNPSKRKRVAITRVTMYVYSKTLLYTLIILTRLKYVIQRMHSRFRGFFLIHPMFPIPKKHHHPRKHPCKTRTKEKPPSQSCYLNDSKLRCGNVQGIHVRREAHKSFLPSIGSGNTPSARSPPLDLNNPRSTHLIKVLTLTQSTS